MVFCQYQVMALVIHLDELLLSDITLGGVKHADPMYFVQAFHENLDSEKTVVALSLSTGRTCF